MTPRMNIFQTAPEGSKAMLAVEVATEKSGLCRWQRREKKPRRRGSY